MSSLLRFILIAVLVYLVARSLLAILIPRRRRDEVKGKPRGGGRIDRERIQDADFKDLPDK